MKNKLTFLIPLGCFLFVLLLLFGCHSKNDKVSNGLQDNKAQKVSSTDTLSDIASFANQLKESGSTEEQEVAKLLEDFLAQAPDPVFPLWSKDNLGWHTEKILLNLNILSSNPPFYKGSLPLVYNSGSSPGGILFLYDFGDFQNQFKLNESFIIIGVRTIDEGKNLLAEARVRYYVKGNQQGIELEEFHYDSKGKVIFKCKSEVDANSGFKIKESNKVGKKKKDYYFIWPHN
jgi:hypothetical protein